jgi:hypothetical protein
VDQAVPVHHSKGGLNFGNLNDPQMDRLAEAQRKDRTRRHRRRSGKIRDRQLDIVYDVYLPLGPGTGGLFFHNYVVNYRAQASAGPPATPTGQFRHVWLMRAPGDGRLGGLGRRALPAACSAAESRRTPGFPVHFRSSTVPSRPAQDRGQVPFSTGRAGGAASIEPEPSALLVTSGSRVIGAPRVITIVGARNAPPSYDYRTRRFWRGRPTPDEVQDRFEAQRAVFRPLCARVEEAAGDSPWRSSARPARPARP